MLLYTYSKNLLNKEVNTIMGKKEMLECIEELREEIVALEEKLKEKDSIIEELFAESLGVYR